MTSTAERSMMTKEEFEAIVQEVFDMLPGNITERIENVHIVVEDYPHEATVKKMKLSSKFMLLGLYEGIPLNQRGTGYGMSATIPDKVTLYKRNIEDVTKSHEELREKIREVLIHELGHYHGMNEQQVRDAGY